MDVKTALEDEVSSKVRIFISYSRKDMTFADRLEAALKKRGYDPLIDRDEIYAFEDWWKRIETLIGRADTVVFVLSPDAVTSTVALKEVSYAASLNKRFAPIVYRQVDDNAVPEPLRRLNFVFFDDIAIFDASADRLAEALQTDIGWIRRHTEFGDTARQWVQAGRPNGMLLRSPVLEQAEAWITLRPQGAPLPSDDAQTFIAESRKAEVREKRQNRILQAAIYTSLIGIIAGLIGWINQSYIAAQWRWSTTTRPYAAAKIWPYVLTAAAERALRPADTFRECAAEHDKDYCPEMIVVPAGSFMMGSPSAEPGHESSEEPEHKVTISKPFAVSKYDLTFAGWDTCATYGVCDPLISDGGWGRGQQPVIYVTWDDAERYVEWLSQVTGQPYRLLSEAEYEYAARAGTHTAYPWGEEIGANNANCRGCGSQWDNQHPATVGRFAPNKFGLYDVVGNVWSWVEDCFHDNYDGAPTDGSAWIHGANCSGRSSRGGAWDAVPNRLRSASRGGGSSNNRFSGIGFRVARTIVAP